MIDRVESLKRSLQLCDGYINDHDCICMCRPVDVRAALSEIERLRAALEEVQEAACAACDIGGLGQTVYDIARAALRQEQHNG